MTTVLESINKGLHACLAEFEEVYFLGEDVLDPYGGAFKASKGLSTAFPERTITTPVSEAGLVGVGVGMALRGYRPIIEIMFGDFILLAADQLINHGAKFRWMSNNRVTVPLVVRTPMGGRRGYGPTHSQTLEKHVLGAPGLRVVAVNTLARPETVLRAAVLDDDPVIVIEHKALYPLPVLEAGQMGEFESLSTEGGYPIHRLRVRGAPPPGVTIACYGFMAHLGLQAIQRLAYEYEIFTELFVLTDLIPSNGELLLDSVECTGRLLTVEEGTKRLGWGAELISGMVDRLRGPVHAKRIAALDMPVPASGPLEEAMLPQVGDLIEGVRELVRGR
jgi:pyruvate/2-oxoglutarate/acetoin dehydrogenase E1 component